MDGGVIHRQAIDRGLDIHPSRKAIVVHYALEAVATNEFGEPVVADSKDCAKIINIKGLSRTTNVPNLAKHIVESCNLIDPAKLPMVEQLLLYLQARRSTKEGEAEKDVLEASTKKLHKQIEDLENSEEASMVELDVYVEGLYDDLHAKTKSTELILQLARLPENLIELADNNSLLLALSRVLRDDWKKSIDLTTNITFFFFCFSTFSDFHRLLTQHKIGSLCMTVVEHELKRHRALQDDVSKKKKEVKVADGTTTAKKEYEKARKRYHSLLKKQDTLLRVCLYLLCNLAEDTRVELKMHGKGLVKHLMALLERDNTELLILVVSFLKKMSIFRENKDQMAEGNIVKKLVRIIPSKNEILLNMALRLLLNLSFDPALRLEIVRGAFLPELTALLDKESHVKVVLSILYHISFDSKNRALFAYTDCIPKLMKMIVECPENRLEPEIAALGINLASTQFGAQEMCKGPGLKMLMRRTLNTGDPQLLKMLRNISQHSGAIKKLFLGYIPDLVEMMKKGTGEEEEGAVEAAGILGNLNIPDLDFGKIVRDLQLLPFLTGKLKDLSVNDDMLLELVVLCGTFSQDESCAVLLVDAGLPPLLITCLKERQEEDELVLQIVYVFYYLVLHQATRQTVLSTSQAPEYLLELMSDKNKAVSDLCIKTLDIIAEEDSELGQRVKTNRFRWHNCNWLEIVTGESLCEEEDEEEEDEDYLDLLRSAAELDEPDYFYSSLDGAPVTVPVGEMDDFERDGFLLQHYGVPPPTVAHSPAGYGDSLAPQNAPHYYEAQLGANHAAVPSSPYPPRPMSRADNPLASPGMLFDREYSNEVEPTSISARQLMSSLEDPLAMYNASFKTALDMNQSVDYDDSVDDVGYSTGHPGTNYSTVLEGGMGQTQQRGSSNRVGF